MKKATITFIGAGHLGGALIGGLINAGYPSACIWATAPTATHLDELQQRFAIHTTENNLKGVLQADILVLAVKPQVMKVVVDELRPVLLERNPLVISVAAGISAQQLHAWLDGRLSIIRAMPNTPALVGHGATALYADASVSVIHKQEAEAIFTAVGSTLWVDEESQMSAITALSGSGPAYFFLLMEALEEAALELGLPLQIAHDLTAQTALGAAHMVLQSQDNPAKLRQQVASPGGGTEQALAVLESGKFKELLFRALQAAKQRYDVLIKE